MMYSLAKFLGTAMMAGALMVVAGGPADAAFKIRLTNGADTVTAQDNVSNDASPGTGSIVFVGAVGQFTLDIASSLSKPVIGTPGKSAQLNINNNATSGPLSVSGGNSGVLTIEVTDTGFTLPPANAAQLFSSYTLNSLPAGFSAQYETFIGTTNAEFDESFSPTGLQGPTSVLGVNAKSASFTNPIAPFSITLKITLTGVKGAFGSSLVTGVAQVTNPEPSTMVMAMCGGLPLLAMGGRRLRRNKAAKAA